MTYHLQRMHINEYEKYLKRVGKPNSCYDVTIDDSPVASEETSEPKQIILSVAFKRAAPLPPNSPRYYSLLRATMN